MLDLNVSPPRDEEGHQTASPTGSHRPGSPTGSLNKASASGHLSESHAMSKNKEKRKYSLTPSLSSSYSDSIIYYPTSGKIVNGEHGSQLRTPTPSTGSPRNSRQRSPTPDSARKAKDRSPTPESARKRKADVASPKGGEPSRSAKRKRYGTPPNDPGISGTKKIVENSPLVLSSSSLTRGHSGSTITPMTAMLLEDEYVYKKKFGHSPPDYQSHSDTRSYDYRGGYASSPGSIQQHLLHDTASSRSPSPSGRQRSQASVGQVAGSSSHGGHAAPAPNSSAQSVHYSGSNPTQSHTVARSSLRREGTTTPPRPSSSSSSHAGSSPHTGAASPAHSGNSVGSAKASRKSGSH